jgi:hypothetical protein
VYIVNGFCGSPAIASQHLLMQVGALLAQAAQTGLSCIIGIGIHLSKTKVFKHCATSCYGDLVIVCYTVIR